MLAGVAASLLAQGLPPFDAAVAAAYLHGAAGEDMRDALGDAGAAASDLPMRIPPVMQRPAPVEQAVFTSAAVSPPEGERFK